MRFLFEYCYNFELIVLIRIVYKKKNVDINVKFIDYFILRREMFYIVMSDLFYNF